MLDRPALNLETRSSNQRPCRASGNQALIETVDPEDGLARRRLEPHTVIDPAVGVLVLPGLEFAARNNGRKYQWEGSANKSERE